MVEGFEWERAYEKCRQALMTDEQRRAEREAEDRRFPYALGGFLSLIGLICFMAMH